MSEWLALPYCVSHCPVSPLPLLPHPQQCRMAGIDKIDDSDISFSGVLTVQAASILLQSSFPRHGHG